MDHRQDPDSSFPKSMGKVAPHSLIAHGIKDMDQATGFTEKELLKIHGVGPKAIRILKEELSKSNKSLKE